MTGVVVRECRVSDLDALLELFRGVADEERWIGTQPGFDEAAYRARWRRTLDGNADALLVAVEGEALVGMVGVRTGSAHGAELGMMVRADRRGRGIGSALLRAAIAWAAARGERTLALLVFPHNAAAIALYERHGFTTVRRIAAYSKRRSGERWDALLMTRPVGARTR